MQPMAFLSAHEDTDKKREIDDGVSEMVDGLNSFGITASEGVLGFERKR